MFHQYKAQHALCIEFVKVENNGVCMHPIFLGLGVEPHKTAQVKTKIMVWMTILLPLLCVHAHADVAITILFQSVEGRQIEEVVASMYYFQAIHVIAKHSSDSN